VDCQALAIWLIRLTLWSVKRCAVQRSVLRAVKLGAEPDLMHFRVDRQQMPVEHQVDVRAEQQTIRNHLTGLALVRENVRALEGIPGIVPSHGAAARVRDDQRVIDLGSSASSATSEGMS
jgi:hypothetical protein